MSEAMQRQWGQMPAWLVFSGVAIGVVEASVNKHSESVGELMVALGSRTDSSDVAMAVALGHLGLVLLVVGAVVVLAGLVVIALAGRHKLAPDRAIATGVVEVLRGRGKLLDRFASTFHLAA